MLKPAVINTPWARAAAVLGAVALAAGSTMLLPARLGAFLHVTSYGERGAWRGGRQQGLAAPAPICPACQAQRRR